MHHMNKKIITSLTSAALFALPLMALAVQIPAAPQGTLTSVTELINPILDLMWQVFIALAFIMVFIAAFLFITANGDPGKLASARQALIWSAVAVGIGIAAFSIPIIIASLFGGA
ncbi:MAG: hypothetical protein Q7S10_01645 [bacterium]|nr:hypothetical protein [bacterium]